MKKLALIPLLLLCLSAAYAQKCDYVKNEPDKFTGKPVIITKTQLFKEFSKQAEIYFGLSSDTFVVLLGYVEVSPQPIESDLSCELWLSLSDGSVLKLKPLEVYKGRVRGSMGNTMESVFKPQYLITKEQMTSLSTVSITAFRMAYTGGAVQKDVPEKFQKKMQGAVKCLLDAVK